MYVLDGDPSGLSSNYGPGIWQNGIYSSVGSTYASGTAKFKFKWQKSATMPQKPPLTAMVLIETSAYASSPAGGCSSSNGWVSGVPGGQISGASASEYRLKATPGDSFEMTIGVSAAVGSVPGFCTVSVKMSVIPVTVSLGNTTWFGAPPAPNILMGEKAVASIGAGGLSFKQNTATTKYYQWTAPGTIFKNWEPTYPTPTTASIAADDLKVASPFWYWKGTATALRNIVGQGVLDIQSNQYEPKNPTVSDDFEVNVVRPTVDVGALHFQASQPWINGALDNNGYLAAVIGTDVDADSGTVSIPSEFAQAASYGFAQVITATTRVGTPGITFQNRIDKGFLYPYDTQNYTVGDEADYHDSPAQGAYPAPPLSANDQFALTIMFKPSSADAKWIPLRLTNWNWNADIANATSIPGYLGSHAPGTWANTANHPHWNGVQP